MDKFEKWIRGEQGDRQGNRYEEPWYAGYYCATQDALDMYLETHPKCKMMAHVTNENDAGEKDPRRIKTYYECSVCYAMHEHPDKFCSHCGSEVE
jgi:hypothetical protein